MYKIQTLDNEGHTIFCDDDYPGTLKEAKQRAKHLLSDDFAALSETSHESLGTERAEIYNQKGECVECLFR